MNKQTIELSSKQEQLIGKLAFDIAKSFGVKEVVVRCKESWITARAQQLLINNWDSFETVTMGWSVRERSVAGHRLTMRLRRHIQNFNFFSKARTETSCSVSAASALLGLKHKV
jgi:hypothetical protein